MNAKFGKLSIGCFIALPLATVFFMLMSGLLGADDGSPLFAIAMLTYFLCPILGITFGIKGIRSKEQPKWYAIIGLLLYAGVVLAFVVSAIISEMR